MVVLACSPSYEQRGSVLRKYKVSCILVAILRFSEQCYLRLSVQFFDMRLNYTNMCDVLFSIEDEVVVVIASVRTRKTSAIGAISTFFVIFSRLQLHFFPKGQGRIDIRVSEFFSRNRASEAYI